MADRKVLLVDDEMDFAETLAARLRSRGLEVTTAISAVEAIRISGKHPFDIVVLDLKMPQINGLEALRIIKEKNSALQVILLTGHATVEKSMVALLLGAADIIEKPLDVETLISKIEKALTRKMVKV